MHYRFHDFILNSTVALPELRPSTAGWPQIRIELENGPAPDPDAWFHRWRVRGAGKGARPSVWLSLARQDGGYLLRFAERIDFQVARDGDRVVCRPAGGGSNATMRHLLLDQVLPLVLSRSGRLVLHASAVHVPGVGTIGFAGRTGSGKSTLAAALGLRGCEVVTDDCLVVSGLPGAPVGVPGYSGLRLWRDSSRGLGLPDSASRRVASYTTKRRFHDGVRFRSRRSPLRALFVLGATRPAGKPTLSRALRGRASLVALAPYTYMLDVEERRQLAQMFGNLSALAGRVPVLRLNVRQCTPGRWLGAADEVLALVRSW